MEIDLEMDLPSTRMGTGETMEIFLVLHRLKEETSHKLIPIAKLITADNLFRRSDNRPTTGFTPYEHKFPESNNHTSSNVVLLTTTDNTNNKISDLCPLNYEGL